MDLEQDRIGRANPNLVGAKHVAELIRTVAVGIDGRIGKRLEDELNDSTLVQNTNRLLDVLVEAFPILDEVADGELAPEDLRKSSLLGSTTMLRVLAGVYQGLLNEGWHDEDLVELLRAARAAHGRSGEREQHLGPARPRRHLHPRRTGPDRAAPGPQRLTETITAWAQQRPEWLDDNQPTVQAA